MIYEKKLKNCKSLLSVLAIAIMLTTVLLGTSCKSKLPIITASDVSTNIHNHSSEISKKLDSVFVHRTDSVIIQMRGDTVFHDRWRTEYKFKLLADTFISTDTVFVQKTSNTIQTVVEKKPLRWWQKTLMWFGGIFIVLFIYMVYVKLLKNI